jgi:hypothetical protein
MPAVDVETSRVTTGLVNDKHGHDAESLRVYFFTSEQAGSGGWNAWSPGMVVSTW